MNTRDGGAAPTGDEVHDVAVVGAGASGLSAALLLGRARRRVVVIDAGEPRNAPAAYMHGFLSRDGLSPATLLDLGRAEIDRYGVDVVRGRVEHVEPGYDVRLEGGPVIRPTCWAALPRGAYSTSAARRA
ncbi:FAD-binding protein [Streptomyces sp. NPDC014727]